MPIAGMNVSIYGNGNHACLQHHVSCVFTEFTRERNVWTIGVRFPIGMDDGESCTWSVIRLKSVVIHSNTALLLVQQICFLHYSAICFGVKECNSISWY
jgi:hypothetical protein